jgi:hypothetical protein
MTAAPEDHRPPPHSNVYDHHVHTSAPTRERASWRAIGHWLLVGVVATTLIACGTTDPGPDNAATTDSTATADTPLDSAVPEALRFTAPLVGGGEFDGAAPAGRPVAFWFWAPT